ncbi:MAG: hypothetical protein J0L81_05120 [Caulobacterales bacterium]|jgi:uncharacterized membrane protein YgdD (TMEM256/DUF423 family)|nr:hypothetical protein [Caulobacterales bacterium]
MRLLNIFAALSGFIALVALVYSSHGLRETPVGDLATAIDRMRLAGFIQLGAAITGLALANRIGRLNLIGGALILAGAAIFAFTLYGISILGTSATFAPVGGITLLMGWAVLVFAKPGS